MTAWILDGAAVRVSLIGFDNGFEVIRTLDGRAAQVINADLTDGVNVTDVQKLIENANLSFKGVTLQGPFDLTEASLHLN